VARDQATVTKERAEPAGLDESLSTLNEINQAFVSIAESMTPSVVSINTRGQPHQNLPGPFEDLFRQFRQQPQEELPFDVPLGRGSGFIVSEEGYILTNNHVVAAAEKIEVDLPDGRSFPARLVGRDPTTDVAVLKIDATDLPALNLGNSDRAQVGELVMAIGNPGFEFGSALPFTVTTGIISGTGRNLGIIQRAAGAGRPYAIEDLIQTDAVINPGNSGGPLVNHRGEVIGINTAIASVTGYYQGYGFAIPINLARDVMEDLIEYGAVRRAALRVIVEPVSRALARNAGLDEPRGAIVQDFPDDSPAEDAGIRRGDIIVAVNDRPINRVGQLQGTIASYEPGERVEVTVVRNGETKVFKVKLAEADVPQPETGPEPVASRPSTAMLGIQVTNAQPALLERYEYPEGTDVEGVLVTNVARFGPAFSANLTAGTVITRVNGKKVADVDEFDEALGEVEPGQIVTFDTVYPNGDDLGRRIVAVEVTE
jgi:serine protease Do